MNHSSSRIFPFSHTLQTTQTIIINTVILVSSMSMCSLSMCASITNGALSYAY